MEAFSQIGSTLGDLIDAALHPSVANLPAGFLVLVLAAFGLAALPDGARQKVRLAALTTVGLIISLSLSLPVSWAAMLR
jgi:hypothetical protein